MNDGIDDSVGGKNARRNSGTNGVAMGAKRDVPSLNPRITQDLNRLYDGIVNDPLPDKITQMLERLRKEERAIGEMTARDAGNDSDQP